MYHLPHNANGSRYSYNRYNSEPMPTELGDM